VQSFVLSKVNNVSAIWKSVGSIGQLQRFSLELAVGASTNHMHCGLERSKGGGNKQVNAEHAVLSNVTL
jgi:hypothetical protein